MAEMTLVSFRLKTRAMLTLLGYLWMESTEIHGERPHGGQLHG